MDRRNIFAYTALTPYYPEYVSINCEVDGTISIIVRNPAKEDGSCGETASVKLSVKDSIELARQFATLGTNDIR